MFRARFIFTVWAGLVVAGLMQNPTTLQAQDSTAVDAVSPAVVPESIETVRLDAPPAPEPAPGLGGTMERGRQQVVDQGRALWQEVLLPAGQRIASAVPVVLKALVLLLAFWLAGKLAGAAVRKLFNATRLDDRAVRDWGLDSLLKRSDGTMRSLGGLVGGAVQWLLVLFGVVAFFNALNLGMVAGPLQNLLDRIVGVVPNLIQAAVMLTVYWAVAAVVRAGVTRALGAVKFDARFGRHLGASDSVDPASAPSAMIGRLLFYVILLFGLPPFLQALGQESLVLPLQEMLGKALGFLPNLFAAALILVVGRIVATIVREVIAHFLSASGADAGAAKLGLGSLLGGHALSAICAQIAYFFILIPIVVAAVDSLGISLIADPIKSMLETLLAAVPALLLAAVIVAVGYVAARLVRSLIESALGGIGFDALPGKLNLAFLAGREGQLPPSRLVGGAAAAVIVLITAQQAFASLRLVQLANLVGAIVAYLPHLAVGLVILLAALSLASYLASLVSGAMAHHPHARLLSGVVRYAVILLGASMALEQLNVGREIIMIAVGALAGGSALALGLAFGLGGKDRARSLIDTWTGKPSGGAGPA